jgi:hypothetical protein
MKRPVLSREGGPHETGQLSLQSALARLARAIDGKGRIGKTICDELLQSVSPGK